MRLRSADAGEVRYNPRGSGTAYARQFYLWITNGRLVLVEEFRGAAEQRTSARFTRHLDAIYGPEEAAFLRAIHASPADAAPRLVYADWLDERNDPRGAAIRLVERLRTMSPEAAARERGEHNEVFAQWLPQGLWAWVLGYDSEAAAARPIFTA
ncbi:MAG: TIGR02996 domain-containing protein [Zavarzinella sp.]|nr:TIGR02996 domain-containing protein [Zavarzinella sp.]